MLDDIFLPDESPEPMENFDFEQTEIELGKPEVVHASGINASDYVKITFDRFVALVANHSFSDVVENNRNEEVIISTNLLTDLANSRRFVPSTKVPLMILGGIVVGILAGYFIFNGV
ncbi:MAG: hypothetical protein ACI9QC_000207 [Oceanicoccus sp.]|jgi:hypothetical protein